jgi:hypothetical protein
MKELLATAIIAIVKKMSVWSENYKEPTATRGCSVTPAEVGIQEFRAENRTQELDFGLRRNDGMPRSKRTKLWQSF